jgi:predicted O-linked N-acetylglucosamine transferase (SPINDLY family)
MENLPPVVDLPALSNSAFTFGCLNNPAKLNDDVFRQWARILHAVPSARLRLHLHVDSGYRERVMKRAAELGLDPARVDWQGRDTGFGYFRSYGSIDLALDPFPYGGGATTCDAMWMGVPTVTLTGDRFMSRIGGSLMQQGNLGQFVASSPEEYVGIAVDWASRVEELARLRQDMRAMLKAAPLLDQHGFMRGLEAEYRRIWTEWCQRQQPGCSEPSMAVAER